MTKVKICGLTNAADAQAALDAGADLLGFIFYEPSPRYVSPDTVKSIIAGQLVFGANRPLLVGVFVDESPERVREVLEFCGLDAAQLHGSEPPSALAQLAGRAYKVFRPQSRAEFEQTVAGYQLTMSNE
ncbi:MAG: N-(5'-phosphoribosyl)anthranilate isomerase, partial [Chloroflexi bacterium]